MGTRRGQLASDIGSTGLKINWGQIEDDFLREWNGQEKVKRIDEMVKNSPIIGALRLAIEYPLRDITWQWTSDVENDPRVELLNEAWENMTHSWHDHLSEALLFPFYGWSMFTITYERVNGRWLWRKFKMLGHDTVQRWLLGDDGGLAGLQQWPHEWPDPIPIERMLIYRLRKTRGNPEGESILRPAWTSWYYVKNIQQIEAIGLERNLAGLPVIEMPIGANADTSSTDYTTADKVVRNVRNDEQAGVVLPPPTGDGENHRWRLSLLSGGGMSKTIDTDMVIGRYEKRMLTAALAQFLLLGQDKVGALSLSKDQTDFFTMSLNANADIIADTFTKYAAARLLRLNGMDPAGVRLEHSPAGDTDLTIIADFLQKTGALLTWTPEDEAWLRGVARLPARTVEELERLRDEATAPAAAPPTLPDMNRAEVYAAGNAPDDDARRRLERKWTARAAAFFDEQQQRVVQGVANAAA